DVGVVEVDQHTGEDGEVERAGQGDGGRSHLRGGGDVHGPGPVGVAPGQLLAGDVDEAGAEVDALVAGHLPGKVPAPPTDAAADVEHRLGAVEAQPGQDPLALRLVAPRRQLRVAV